CHRIDVKRAVSSVVEDKQERRVTVDVRIDRYVVHTEKLEADGFDVIRITGQERPPRPQSAVHLRKTLEGRRVVFFRLNGHRVHEQVLTHPSFQGFVNLDQI